MLEFDRSYVSEDTDTNKTDALSECSICYYWYFLKVNFRLEPKVCDGYHDMTQKSMSFDEMIMELTFGS